MVPKASAGRGQCQEPEASKSRILALSSKQLGNFLLLFPSKLAGSWTGSGAAETLTGTNMEGCLLCGLTTLPHPNPSPPCPALLTSSDQHSTPPQGVPNSPPEAPLHPAPLLLVSNSGQVSRMSCGPLGFRSLLEAAHHSQLLRCPLGSYCTSACFLVPLDMRTPPS